MALLNETDLAATNPLLNETDLAAINPLLNGFAELLNPTDLAATNPLLIHQCTGRVWCRYAAEICVGMWYLHEHGIMYV